MAILNNSNAISTSAPYDINNSLRLRASASAYLNRTPATAGNRQKFTLSVWIKLGELGTNKILLSTNTSAQQFRIYTDNTIGFGNSGVANYQSTGVLRDPSAWYHIVCKVDTTLASGKVVIYVNNTIYLTTDGGLSLNANTQFNNTVVHYIGRDTESPNAMFFDGYMAEYNFIDGQALTPSSFGETSTTTGSWVPKAYTGTYGTNGFYLKFSDIATTSGSNAGLGKDFSGNANYWTTNNISVTAGTTYDAMIDSPTLTSATVANYAVMNPLVPSTGNISQGNLLVSTGTTNASATTFLVSTGKWYWEVVWVSGSAYRIGVCNTSGVAQDLGGSANGWAKINNPPRVYNNGSTSSYGTDGSVGDTFMVALDLDAGKIWYGINGTWQASGSPSTGANPSQTFTANQTMTPSVASGTGTLEFNLNFGQRPFAYTPPSGYLRLNTYNLPDSTIVKGNTVMDATLYTGTGANATITNAGAFKPDLVWVKVRSTTGTHILTDSNRGANKQLFSNLTNAEATSTIKITGFTSTGFTLGADDGTGTGDANFNGSTFVGWQWQAGQGSTSSNTSGSITSTVSVNATAGFSIVTYTGTGANATVGHGLGVAPKMIFIKNRTSGSLNWGVYNATIGNTKVLLLNTTAAASAADPSFWNNTSPTSTTFSLSTWPEANNSGNSFVAYCWAEIAGFSKFGSYTGNGSADGPFVFLGFRPKYVLFKRTDTVAQWIVEDTTRSTYNVIDARLFTDSSEAELSNGNGNIDYLSNGFKLRNSHTAMNASGGTYIYAAFAENPFKNANAR